jgi:hypothetical protein
MARAAVPRSTPPRRVTRSQSRELDVQSGIAFSKAAAQQGSNNAKASSSRECHLLFCPQFWQIVRPRGYLCTFENDECVGICDTTEVASHSSWCLSLVVTLFVIFTAHDAVEMNDTF